MTVYLSVVNSLAVIALRDSSFRLPGSDTCKYQLPHWEATLNRMQNIVLFLLELQWWSLTLELVCVIFGFVWFEYVYYHSIVVFVCLLDIAAYYVLEFSLRLVDSWCAGLFFYPIPSLFVSFSIVSNTSSLWANGFAIWSVASDFLSCGLLLICGGPLSETFNIEWHETNN